MKYNKKTLIEGMGWECTSRKQMESYLHQLKAAGYEIYGSDLGNCRFEDYPYIKWDSHEQNFYSYKEIDQEIRFEDIEGIEPSINDLDGTIVTILGQDYRLSKA